MAESLKQRVAYIVNHINMSLCFTCSTLQLTENNVIITRNYERVFPAVQNVPPNVMSDYLPLGENKDPQKPDHLHVRQLTKVCLHWMMTSLNSTAREDTPNQVEIKV